MNDPYRAPRLRMVERLPARIDDERVLDAMARVPREEFVPAEGADAYADRPLPIGSGQTISAPDIVALMAQALRLTGTQDVLEVGGGAGYAAAVLSRCARSVVTIERHGVLARRARDTLSALGYANVEVRHADGTAGAADRAPFDGISVAAITEGIPDALTAQLTEGGRLVCPVGTGREGELIRLHRGVRARLGPVVFVPLVGGAEE